MAAHIAETLSGVDWPTTEDNTPAPSAAAAPMGERAIAVVQAGTGRGQVGRLRGHRDPAGAGAAEARDHLHRHRGAAGAADGQGPAGAGSAALPQPFTFALAKGRGRYVCRLKLDQLSGGDAASADLFESDDAPESASQSPDALAAHTVASAAASARAAERWDERARSIRPVGRCGWTRATGTATATSWPSRPRPSSGARWRPSATPAPRATARATRAAATTARAPSWRSRR